MTAEITKLPPRNPIFALAPELRLRLSDMYCITAGTETLFRQAPMTAHTYMLKAISDIDELLGKGYAKQHPELIAAYMQTAAIDFGAAIIARGRERRKFARWHRSHARQCRSETVAM